MTIHHLKLTTLFATLGMFGACATVAPHPSPAVPSSAGPLVMPVPPVEGQDFRVYRSDGTPGTLRDIVQVAGAFEAVLLGEEHDDDIGHRIQLELFRQMAIGYGDFGPMAGGNPDRGMNQGVPGVDGQRPPLTSSEPPRPIVLSLEMFERDVQYILDEYLAGLITETHFRSSARPWDTYEAHYRPLVEFSKEHGIPVIAANAPRRYVNRASRLGRESLASLPPSARAFLPPLPWPAASAAYRAEWDALMGDAALHMSGDPLDGQTLWDATMGESIARALNARDNALVVHLAGGFHVENGTGTPEALQHYRPGTRTLIVAVRKQPNLGALPSDLRGAGDWVILTRETSSTSQNRIGSPIPTVK